MQTKNTTFLFLLLTLFQLVQSQSNIEKIEERFEEWEKSQETLKRKQGHRIKEQEKEDGYTEHFERWKHFAKIRSNPNGELYENDRLWQEFVQFQQHRPPTENIWYPLGPTQTPNAAGGVGRVNVLRFSPENPTIIWAGTACGGLWKSTDNGQNWQNTTTDNLPSISVADIAINPQNPDILYIATGDGAGYEVTVGNHTDFWGGTYSAGIFKSEDGGMTWQNIGLTYQQTQSEVIHRLLISPENPNILLAATRNGIFRTQDAGQTWAKINNISISDMEFHPSMPNIIYASGSRSVFISNDLGLSWQTTTQGFFPIGKLSISVSKDAPNQVYVMSDLGEIYQSLNNGEDFHFVSTAPCTFYAYYSTILEVSPVNSQHLVAGGVELAHSFDGGKTWNVCSNYDNFSASNYVHADQHFIGFQPITNKIWVANDGGIAATSDYGTHWQSYNKGLNIAQFYRVASAESQTELLYGGLQDNGVMQDKNGNWAGVMNEGDGMDCMVNAQNENEVYAAYQFGKIYKSENGGKAFYELESPGGGWITPFVFQPNEPNTLYYGGKNNVYVSKDAGETWENYSPNLFSEEITTLIIPQKQPDYLYAASFQAIFRTTDKGITWEKVHGKLPISDANISDISVSDYEPNKIWVSFSGFAAEKKVFYSEDGGKTWQNISDNLPNIPINCIEYQQSSDNVLYVGTDFGVFIKNGKNAHWEYWNTNLPNVIVNELEILYEKKKIRAATFGRGLWEAELSSNTFASTNAEISIISPNGNICNSVVSPVVKLTNWGIDTLKNIDFLYYIDSLNTQKTYNWNGNLAYGESEEVLLPQVVVRSDSHNIWVQIIHPNGGIDAYSFDNQDKTSFSFFQNNLNLPYLTDFEDSINWGYVNIQNTEIWKRENVSSSNNSDYALMANLYNQVEVPLGNATITFDKLNFSDFQAPISLRFDVAHVLRYDNSFDTLRVEVSSDCAHSWQSIYEKSGQDLATENPDFQYFKPNPNQWRKEILNLSGYAGKEVVYIRFNVAAKNTNNLWLDNIQLENTDAYSNNFAQQISIYPTIAQSELFFEIKGDFSDNVEVSIWNTTGQLIDFQKIEMNFQRKQKINLSELSAGIYIFQIRTDKKEVRSKILIMK